MSYNIHNVETLVCDAWIANGDVGKLLRDLKEEDEYLPEDCFLDEMAKHVTVDFGEVPIRVPRFAWCGDGSGSTYESVLIERVAPLIRGRIEAIFTWERGDSLSGLWIVDGKVTECDVVRTLVPKNK